MRWNSHKVLSLAALALFSALPGAMAEGSSTLMPAGAAGNRHYLRDQPGFAPGNIPATTTFFVYVNPGETLLLGSSANGINSGRINYRPANASAATAFTLCPTTGVIGRITTRAQELAGPLPNTDGYTPCSVTVGAGQGGLWEVFFTAPTNTSGTLPGGLANAAWSAQGTGDSFITAWDVTVRSGGATVGGRLFTNVLTASHTDGDIRSTVYVQTSDGYRYRWNTNGVAPGTAALMSNRQGFTNASTGDPLFRSVQFSGGNPGTMPSAVRIGTLPLNPTVSDYLSGLHKLFISPPDPSLPASAPSPRGTTWLVVPEVPPATVSALRFVGLEGSPNQTGTVPLSGVFQADVTGAGTVSFLLDVNNNNSFSDPVDRLIAGTAAGAGTINIPWDGRDGQGNPVSATPGSATVSFRTRASMAGGEVHFPALDFEGNVNGFIIQRLNPATNAVLDSTIYFNDPVNADAAVGLPRGGNGTSGCGADAENTGNPASALTGIDSSGGAHRWTNGSGGGYGNCRGMDTWAYVLSPALDSSLAVRVMRADLEAVSLTPSSTLLAGAPITYTLTVRNTGPSNSPAATVFASLPAEVTGLSIVGCTPAGGAVCTSQTLSGNSFSSSVNLPSGGSAVYVIQGTVGSVPAGGLIAAAGIQRQADITDPTATNPDAAPPAQSLQGVRDECNATAAGSGNGNSPACNNLKVSVFSGSGTLSGTLYNDNNTSGTFQPASDTRFPAGVAVELVNSGGTVVATVDTDASGNYSFANVPTGTYTVRVVTSDPQIPGGSSPTAPASASYAGVVINTNATTTRDFGFQRAGLDVIKSAGAPVPQTPATPGAVVFEVPFTVVVGNTGQLPAPNVQVSENLSRTFSGGSPTIALVGAPTVTPSAGATCTANPAFNGTSVFGLLAGTDDLSAGQSCTVSFRVRLTYPSAGALPGSAQNNQVYASSLPGAAATNPGHTFPGGTPTPPAGATLSDASTNAADPASPSGLPGTPGGDTPGGTAVTFVPNPGAITGTLYLDKNNNSSFNDGTDARLGAGVTVELVGGPIPRTAVTDADGNYRFDNVDPGPYTVRVATADPGLRGATPSAPGSGSLSVSVNPGATTANQNFGFVRPALDVLKSAGAPRQINTTTFEVPYTVVAGNTGTTPLPNVQLSENLSLTFAAGGPALTVSNLRQTGGSATCTPNPAFNGTGVLGLLSGSDSMAVGQNCTLSFSVRVVYPAGTQIPSTAQNNTVHGSSSPTGPNPGHTFPGGTPTPPAGATATDSSSNTTNPASPTGLPSAPNSDAPGGTPVTFAQNLGSISGTLYNDRNGNRSFDGTPPDSRLGAGITVELVDSSQNVVATTATDGNGDYSFNAVAPGSYSVRVPTNATNSNNTALGTLQPVTPATVSGVTIQPGTVSNNRNFGFNSPPVADIDNATTPFNTPVTLSATTGDSDPDGYVDASTVDLDPATPGEQKTRTTLEGTWAVDGSGNVTFTPAPGFVGTATLPYTVRDNTGNLSNQAELRVRVQAAQPPVAANDSGATLPDTNVTLDPKLNDSTPNRGATLTPGSIVFPASGQPAGAVIGGDGKSIRIPGEGLYTTGPGGDISFDPDPAFLGSATPIFYTIQDSTGQTSNPASVTIRVRSPAAADDSATTPFATPVTVNPLTNDRVAAGATLVPASVVFPAADQPAGAVRSPDGKRLEVPGEGVYVIDPVTGVVGFTPAAGFSGNTTPVKYTVDDSTAATSLPANIRVTVGPPAVPVASPDSATTPFGTPVGLTPSSNDTAGTGTAIVPGSVDLDPSTPGQETVREVPGQGRFELNPGTGVVTFTPVPGFAGTVQVPYTVKDSLGQTSAPSTLTVSVTPPPAPVARDDSKAGDFNQTVDVPAALNDTSSPNTTLVPGSIDLDPSTPGQETSRTVDGKGTFTVQPDGTVRFVPVPGFEGTAVVPYTVRDNLGQTSNPANVSVTIRPRPAPPAARDDSATTPRGTAVDLNAIANDSPTLPNTLDPASIDLDPATPGRQTRFTIPGRGTFEAQPDGSVRFTPAPGFVGTVTTPYTINDRDNDPTTNPQTSNPANLTVTVSELPGAVSDSARTPVNTPVSVPILTNDLADTGAGRTLNPATVDLDPSTPGQQTSRTVAGQGSFELQPDGSVRFTPEPGFVGVASTPYTVQDSGGSQTNPANIAVTVLPPAPVANDDSARTPFNTPVTLNPNTNDTPGTGGQLLPGTIDLDPSTPGQDARLEVPGQGTFILQPATNLTNESVQFIPVTGFSGTVSIPYTIGDNFGQTSNPANLTVTVNPPSAPIANNDFASTRRDTPVSLTPVLNDTAGAGTNLVPGSVDLDPSTPGQQTRFEVPGQGTFELQPDGSVRFTPAPGFTGTVQAPYTISDALGQPSNTARLVVTVSPLPAAANDTANTPFNTPVTLSPLTNDTPTPGSSFDPATLDLDPLTPGVQDSLTVPGKGTFTRNPDGSVTFTPADGFTGTLTIPYTVQDSGGGLTNTATIAVTVIPPAAPVASNDEARTPYNTPVTLNPAANDRAGSGGTLVPGSIDLDPATPGQQTTLVVPGKGSFTLNPDGSVTFTPADGFVGEVSIPYTIRDNAGQASNPATIRVTVVGPNLTLRKEAVQGTARIGGTLEYVLTAKNDGAGAAIRQVTIEDLLPAGLAYRPGSSSLNGSRTPDPQISGSGGRMRLVWVIGDLAAGQEARLRFATVVTATAPGNGQLVNTATATGQIGPNLDPVRVDSNTATAAVRLEPGVFGDKGTIVGRVYLDKNDDNNFTTGLDEPLQGVRVYLSDGRYAVSDSQGRYSIPEVAPGLSTLRVDRLTVPYLSKAVPDDRGLRGTRQVRVEGAGIYTEDFLFEAPRSEAQVTRSTRVSVDGQRLEKTITQVSANTYTVTLTLTLTKAVNGLQITDPLPTGGARGAVNGQGLRPTPQGNSISLGNLGAGTYTLTYTLTGSVPIDRLVTDPDLSWEGVR